MFSWKGFFIIFVAYLIGSIPTALLYSRFSRGKDIRKMGDGNMGARNTKRQFGWQAGALVALTDILKGTLAVELAVALALPVIWQYASGACVVLGHDFPIFAKFKGGQGFSTTTGVFLRLFPELTLIAFAIYVGLYFTTRSSDLAASLGMGFLAAVNWFQNSSLWITGFIVILLLMIPLKKWADRGREEIIREQQGQIS